jgi:site-specific recombinase
MQSRIHVESLCAVVHRLRPAEAENIGEAEQNIREFIAYLNADDQARIEFGKLLAAVVSHTRVASALAESGILSDKSFSDEVQRRLGAKLLPPTLDESDLRYVLRQLFDERGDWVWVTGIDQNLWVDLIALVMGGQSAPAQDELRAAIVGLSQRIGALGIDEEFTDKLQEVRSYDSPFLDLTVHARAFVEAYFNGTEFGARRVLMGTIRECRDIVIYIREHKREFGTSLRLTSLSRRLLQQLDRLELLVYLMAPLDTRRMAYCVARLFVELVEANRTDASLRRFMRHSADLVLFQITEETAKKGQKYITNTAPGYWAFLRKAMAGGAIVAVFALVKTVLAGMSLSLGAQAALYSLNYAACFVLIYLTGSILATKQPAVTASAIGRHLDATGPSGAEESGALERVADVVVQVWRSQFVSFVGNLICAFPVALVIVWLLGVLGIGVATPGKVQVLFDSVDPLGSAALFYAAIAGGFLFLAGVISGSVDNRMVYSRVEERLSRHPALESLGARRERVAAFVRDHLGMLTGNVALGIFLGSAGTIGIILGLPFDIRHIAFSSAHVGTAVASAPSMVTAEVLTTAALGVVLIGFVNFVVSFGATMWMTLESRRASFEQWRELIAILWTRLRRRPADWFVPPSEERVPIQPST